MSDYPGFIEWAGLDELRAYATDEEISKTFSGSLPYAMWESGKAWSELAAKLFALCCPEMNNKWQFYQESNSEKRGDHA